MIFNLSVFWLREKMDKSKNGLNEESTGNSRNHEIFLIIGIDKNKKIIQFNKECEKITGYSRYEALNKEFFDFLIPGRYFKEWKRMFDSARQDEVINDLKLPWLTRQGQEVMVSWSSFPVEEVEGEMEDICLVGKLIIPDFNEKESLLENIKGAIEDKESIIEFIKSGLENKADVVDKTDRERYEKDEKVFNLGKNRVIFKNVVSAGSKKIYETGKKKIPSRKEEKKTPIKTKPVQIVKEKKIDVKYKHPIESYRGLDKIIQELKKKNKKLEKENKKLEKNLKSLRSSLSNIKKDKKSKIPALFDPLSNKSKREELENMIHELDERKIMLDNLEAQLTNEKENINKKRDEFFKWREKLELLEDEIENRRKELVDQERMFDDRFVSSSDLSIRDKFVEGDGGSTFDFKSDEELSEPHKILDKIPECAAIVQRGILKQVNRPFIELLGYDTKDMLLDKSLLDFIASEGLSGIEEYYLNRLKGVAVSTYETILLTSDNRMIHVEIITKPVVYNGEKADIAVVRNLKYMEQEKGINQ